MSFRKISILALLLCAYGVQDTGAQESPATPAGEQVVDAAAAKEEFNKLFAQFKQGLAQIETLTVEYQTADEDRRAAIQQEVTKRYEQNNALVPKVVGAALTAFKAAGGKDEQLEQFLVSVAATRMGEDRYEETAQLIKVLTEAGVQSHPAIPVWGVVAAFATADYDQAAKYVEAAKENGMLGDNPRIRTQQDAELVGLAGQIRDVLDKHKSAWEKEKMIRAKEAMADDLPRVLLKTSKGDITIELFENEAPNTIKNFITLVEKGAYNGTAFHRVLPNFMAQAGDPQSAGRPPHDFTIPCECYREDARKHFRGTLSMAHAGRDTGSGQFFLTFRPTPHLDGNTFAESPYMHTVFGRVIDGMNLLADLNRIDPMAPSGVSPDRIIEAKVLRKRPGTDYSNYKRIQQ